MNTRFIITGALIASAAALFPAANAAVITVSDNYVIAPYTKTGATDPSSSYNTYKVADSGTASGVKVLEWGGSLSLDNTASATPTTLLNSEIAKSDGTTPDSVNPATAATTGFPASPAKPTVTVGGKNSANTLASARNTNVYNNGVLAIGRYGESRGTIVHAGGLETVQSQYATAYGTTLNGGRQTLGTANGYNGAALNTTINSGGVQEVTYQGTQGGGSSGGGTGLAIGATVNASGTLVIGYNQFDGIQGNGSDFGANSFQRKGLAGSVTAEAAAAAIAGSSISVQKTTVNSGGIVVMYNGAAADAITVKNGGLIILNGLKDPNSSLASIANAGKAPLLRNATLENGAVVNLSLTAEQYRQYTTTQQPVSPAPATYRTLILQDGLAGAGTFYMFADLASNTGDKIQLVGDDATRFTGNHKVYLVSNSLPADNTSLPVVQATPDVLTGTVNPDLFAVEVTAGTAGDVRTSTLEYSDDQGWVVGNMINPMEDAALGAYAAASALWYSSQQTLQNRMGELRISGGTRGVWLQARGGQWEVDAGQSTKSINDYYGIQGGIDERFGKYIYAGLTGSYDWMDQTFNEYGDGKAQAWSLGVYVAATLARGWYADLTARYLELKQDLTINTLLGTAVSNYTTPGQSVSLEIGKQLKLGRIWTIEPQAQLSYTRTDDVTYTNGTLNFAVDSTTSLIARAGILIAPDIAIKSAGGGKLFRPYARLSVLHEFDGETVIHVSRGKKAPEDWKADLSGTRIEGALGLSVRFKQSVYVYGEIGASDGDALRQPWGASLGIRYGF